MTPNHRRQLEQKSGIASEILSERGVVSIAQGRALSKGFSPRQRSRAPGICLTIHRSNGETSHTFRPDKVDPENPGHRYEQPSKRLGGPGNVLDVHPSLRYLTGRKDVPVIFAEGINKAAAVISVARDAGIEIIVVAISGVWNFLSGGVPIADMFAIPVEGRRVAICFDLDILTNPNVQEAAQRLAEHRIERKAKVTAYSYILLTPVGEGGKERSMASRGSDP